MYARLREAASFLNQAGDFFADTGILVHDFEYSGFRQIVIRHEVPYSEIPGMPVQLEGTFYAATIGSHNIQLIRTNSVIGEKVDMQSLAFPIRLMFLNGVRKLFLLNRCQMIPGANWKGGLLLVEDHINLTFQSPLTGPNVQELGPRFPDMSAPYDEGLRQTMIRIAKEENIALETGIYAMISQDKIGVSDPDGSGAVAIGNTLLPEVITARHMDMKVCALSIPGFSSVHSDNTLAAFQLIERVISL